MLETYAYKARDKAGNVLDGKVEAESQELVVARLKEMGFIPVSVTRSKRSLAKTEIKIPGLTDRITPKDVAVFCRQFATMISSGLTLLRALNILVVQAENPNFQKTLQQVKVDIERGSSLSVALSKHPKVFDHLFVAMVRSGESGGVLDEVLMRLSNTLEKQVEIRRKMKSAMTYPVAVLILVVLILTAMMIFVIPTFKKIFASLHGQLPLPTRILMAVSHIFVAYLPLVVLFYIGATVGFIRFRRSKRGREFLDRLILRIPIFGKLAHKYAIVRFSRTLASLLRSGVPILNSLSITAEAAGNVKMVEAVADIEVGVKQGEPLARRMAMHSIFPPMVTQMVSVGEETGGVDDMLDKVASFYESEVEAMVASLSSLLEPVLIVILGSVVGSMVISLYLPMFNVYKLIN